MKIYFVLLSRNIVKIIHLKTEIMRKIYFLGIALIALLLATRVKADNFTPNMFPGQEADRTAFEVSATVAVGEFGKASNVYSSVTNLTSTNQSVAQTCNQGGYNAVLIVGVGTADVTYTENWYAGGGDGGGGDAGGGDGGGGASGGGAGGEGGGGSSIVSTNHTIHYTVVKGQPSAQFTLGREPVTEAKAYWYGSGRYSFTPPSAEVIIKEVGYTQGVYPYFKDAYVSSAECAFSSSNPNVAVIGRGGTVQPVGLGETVITATWEGNSNWEGTSIQYKLTVEEPKQSVSISFAQRELYGYVGDVMEAPTPIIYPSDKGITIDRWVSYNTEVATVDETTGAVTMLKTGRVQIGAWVDEDETYYAAQGTYWLNVSKPDPGLSFEPSEINIELGADWNRPALLNPNGVDLTKGKWYTAWDAPVEISEDGSEIIIKGTGDATITYEYEGDETYAPSIVSYTLHITTLGLKVLGINVTSQNAGDVLGDGLHKVTFDRSSRTLYLNGWNVDVAEMSEEIKNSVILDESGGVLNITLRGNSAIRNANKCIYSTTGAVLIRSESKKDSLILVANASVNSVALQARYLKLHECFFFATGAKTGIHAAMELGISKYGHGFAEATSPGGTAIQCSHFIKGEGGIGGIDILTKGVHYNEDKAPGFYTDDNNKIPATLVEIGKVPMPVATDEETAIAFTEQDPEDNDQVVFSASDKDTFNDETGQLEISSSFTDEQVDEAMETLVPGSSAWTAQLPGTLMFSVPAGEGEVKIKCETKPSTSLQVKMADKDAVSVTQTTLGWAKVKYDVERETRVVAYLHTKLPVSAGARTAVAPVADDPSVGAYIEAIVITPKDAPTAISTLDAEPKAKVVGARKVFEKGKIIIRRGNNSYTADGARIK